MARARTARRDAPAISVGPDSARGIWWRAGLLVLAGLLAYSNSLSGPFIFDDHVSIVENPQIRELWRRSVLFPERELPTAGRPLVNLSFALNYATGGLDVFGYHLVNIALHLFCGLLIFGIIRRTLELPRLSERWHKWSTDLGFAAALLWILHPLNTEAVNYLTQRTEVMMAVFYLLTLYASIRAWRPPSAVDRRWQAVAVASCAAGMACKESMVTAPLMVVLYDGIFLFGSMKEAFLTRRRFYGGLAMSWIVLMAVMWSGPRIHSAGFSSGVSSWTYLLDQAVIITKYLRLAAWPRGLVVNYGWPFPATLASVLPEALIIACLVGLTIAALIRQPKLGFLGVWFFVTLAPTSSIMPIATEVGAERRMYLPLIALVTLAVVGASFITRIGKGAAPIALVLVSAAFWAGTFARNREYASALVLAQTAVERHPTPVAQHLLATELIGAGRHDEAVVHLRQALPGAPRAHYSLGVELLRGGKANEAIDEFQAFLRDQPMLLEAVSARQLLGRALITEQRWPEAIEQFRLMLTMNPSAAQRREAQAGLAEALYGAQRFVEAAAAYSEFLKASPNDIAALTHLAICFVATGRLDDAIITFRRVVDLDPSNADNERNLANALFDHRDADEASVHAARAVELQPGDSAAHELFGRILAVRGKLEEAEREFDRALQLDPHNADAREDLVKLRKFSPKR